MKKFYDYEAKSLNGKNISMKEFEGKVVLIVNTASKCKFTPQYKGLEELYKKYKDKGLVVLGFPCNQFAKQEPGNSEEIKQNCLINYGVSFPMFEKIEVNGENAHPLYKYLKEKLPGLFGQRIKWNFTKFLIDREGRPTKRFKPSLEPRKIEKYIIGLLE